ncbi:TonB-dependent receptor [Aestuariicella hydrocarbonica]|uniref:TonB-dependent receptor n=1 Tax=Pseudomaricurvus hydrocarbonicus TaxID=1470433 RepID=A0A9E5T4F8_9GAMM|nr:TonB-dependent receptor [Aestuariicella hydrocarbonica]NHO67967.1 TonB-dependent receptor [Aestuariicella hydrocarbonica]
MYFQPTKLALAISFIAATHAISGMAQDTTQNNREIEEVTVYAQKRAQSILEVPVSVASYGGDALEQAQVRDLSDLQQVAPSLVFNSSSGATQSIMTIRGIGTAGQNSGLEQSVGVFIDGVYRGRPGSALSDFVDIEAVEVLRGPQGTLFGRNTSAGVISVRSKKPSYEANGHVSLSGGDYGYKQIKAGVTGPLIADTLAYRLSATWQERDGYVENAVTGEDYNDKNRSTVRGQILWDISDGTSLRVMADYTETDEVCCAPVPVFYGPATLGLIANPSPFGENLNIGAPVQAFTPGEYVSPELNFAGGYPDIGDYKTDRNDSSPGDDSFIDGGFSAEFNTDLTESLSLTAIAAHRFFETQPFGDIDMTAADIWSGGRGQDITENSFELRLSHTGERLDWTAGAFYFDQDIDAEGRYTWGEQGAAYLSNVGLARLLGVEFVGLGDAVGQMLGTGLVNFGADGLEVNPAIAGTGTHEEVSYNSESLAFFGQATWNITEALSWTLGVRYSEEEKEADYVVASDDPFSQVDLLAISQSLFNSLRPLQVHIPVQATSDDYDDDDVSVATSLNFELSDSLSVYGRYAQGYKAGGLNLNGTIGQTPGNPVANLDTLQFDPEDTESYEVGVKSFLFDRTLQLNATVFYQTVTDFQVNSFDGVGFTLQNAGEIEGQGLEIDYSWNPTENWIISGGLVLQDIEYADFKTGSTTIAQQEAAGLQARAEGVVPPQDLTGETPNFVSDVTYAGSVTYLHELNSDLMLKLGTSYRYRSDYTTGQDNDSFTENDDYWIWNANVTLAAMDESWAIELWGKNLTDEEVINIGFDTPLQTGSLSAYMEAPMTWGLTGRLNF